MRVATECGSVAVFPPVTSLAVGPARWALGYPDRSGARCRRHSLLRSETHGALHDPNTFHYLVHWLSPVLGTGCGWATASGATGAVAIFMNDGIRPGAIGRSAWAMLELASNVFDIWARLRVLKPPSSLPARLGWGPYVGDQRIAHGEWLRDSG